MLELSAGFSVVVAFASLFLAFSISDSAGVGEKVRESQLMGLKELALNVPTIRN
jgi:hypothetical protein